jgi:hypothetical protein
MTERLMAVGHPSSGGRAYHRPMHLRRAILLMGLILLVSAIVGALVPAPRRRAAPEPPPAVPPTAAAAPVRTLSLSYPPVGEARTVRVGAGAHVVLQVTTSQAGQATVEALGLVASAEPETPARFDLLAARAGSFPVAFEPAAGGPPRTLGTLTVAAEE